MGILNETIDRLKTFQDIDPGHFESLFDEMITSKNVAGIASLLESWSTKGAAATELHGFAEIMRKRARPVNSKHAGLVDIVGTGGSSKKVFNVSTAAAFVAAGAGLKIAKHGNKAATSKTGSADVLNQLGVCIETEPARAKEILDQIGICFMYAPKFHNLSAELASARRSLSKPTLFNQLGPIVNPAGAPFQLIGVWDRALLKPMSEAVLMLGTKKTWIVCGSDGLDEITLSGSTHVSEIKNGEINEFTISPSDFGLSEDGLTQFSNISVGKSASIINDVIDDCASDNAAASIVVINAAAAIYIGGQAASLSEAGEQAKESIATGGARRALNGLIKETNR